MRTLPFARLRVCLALGCLVLRGAAPETREVRMDAYTVSVPANWWVQTDGPLDRVEACNKQNGRCTGTGGGFPLTGVVFLSMMPAESAPEHDRYRTVHDIVTAVPRAGMPSPVISEVDLGPRGGRRQCEVATSSPFGSEREEIYGLSVDGRLFRVWIKYDRPSTQTTYRQAVLAILSSDSPHGGRIETPLR